MGNLILGTFGLDGESPVETGWRPMRQMMGDLLRSPLARELSAFTSA
jgi:hypothetical protein